MSRNYKKRRRKKRRKSRRNSGRLPGQASTSVIQFDIQWNPISKWKPKLEQSIDPCKDVSKLFKLRIEKEFWPQDLSKNRCFVGYVWRVSESLNIACNCARIIVTRASFLENTFSLLETGGYFNGHLATSDVSSSILRERNKHLREQAAAWVQCGSFPQYYPRHGYFSMKCTRRRERRYVSSVYTWNSLTNNRVIVKIRVEFLTRRIVRSERTSRSRIIVTTMRSNESGRRRSRSISSVADIPSIK